MANKCPNESSSEFSNFKEVANFSYQWVIDNFNQNFTGAESPIFSNNERNDITWRMKIEKKTITKPGNLGYVEETTYFMKLLLYSNLKVNVLGKCKFQILCVNPQNTLTSSKRLQFVPGNSYDCFNINKQTLISAQNGFVQDGKVTITCEIKAVVTISIPRTKLQCTLPTDLENFFENRRFTDVTLCASGEEFQAHKGILVSRSAVFSAMFDHEMAETQQNRVNIPDIDAKVLQELLRFIYTGKVLNLDEFAIDLLPAADKYKLQGLKMLCEEELCANISNENAAEVLVLADLHKVDQLKAVAVGYIGNHAVDVSKTDGWNLMIRSHPHLVTEVLCAVSEQLQVLT